MSTRTSESNIDYNARIAELLNVLTDEDENEIDALLNDENFISNDDDMWAIDDSLERLGLEGALESEIGAGLVFVNGINCAAHTMQLVVRGALALLPRHHANVITLATKVAKFFRKETTRNIVKNLGLACKVPTVEMTTRWSSTYIMVRF